MKTLVRQREAIHEHQLALNGSTKVDRSLDSVQKRTFTFRGKSQQPQRKVLSTPQRTAAKCTRCGHDPHPRHKCPTKDSKCHKCHKRGHFSALCFSKAVGEIHDPPEMDNFAFLNGVGSVYGTCWTCTVGPALSESTCRTSPLKLKLVQRSRLSQRSTPSCSRETCNHPPSDFMVQTASP